MQNAVTMPLFKLSKLKPAVVSFSKCIFRIADVQNKAGGPNEYNKVTAMRSLLAQLLFGSQGLLAR